MLTYKELIRTVRELAPAYDPEIRRVMLSIAERFEGVMESKVIRRFIEENEFPVIPGEKRVWILGEMWTIKERSESEDENLKGCDGYCDWTTREIVVEREQYGNLADIERYIRKVIRHEIIHAFLFESGLSQCSGSVENWAMNEEMVDWLAHQGQQIYAAWKEAGALDV